MDLKDFSFLKAVSMLTLFSKSSFVCIKIKTKQKNISKHKGRDRA